MALKKRVRSDAKHIRTIGRLRKLGLTKWAIAKAVGVKWTTLNNWEAGRFAPNAENAAALEEFYEMQKG